LLSEVSLLPLWSQQLQYTTKTQEGTKKKKLRLSSELHYYQRCATSLYILVKMAQNVMEHRSLRFISEPHMMMLHNQLVAHFERIFGLNDISLPVAYT
jgi:hypothetical protein